MIAKSQVRIGGVNYQFECDEKSEKESISKAIVFGNPPTYCDVCKNVDPSKFKLVTNKDKEGHIYIKIKCIATKCGATCGLGEYKDGSGFFWRRPFEVYVPKQAATTAKPTTAAATEPEPESAGKEEVNPDDIPF